MLDILEASVKLSPLSETKASRHPPTPVLSEESEPSKDLMSL